MAFVTHDSDDQPGATCAKCGPALASQGAPCADCTAVAPAEALVSSVTSFTVRSRVEVTPVALLSSSSSETRSARVIVTAQSSKARASVAAYRRSLWHSLNPAAPLWPLGRS